MAEGNKVSNLQSIIENPKFRFWSKREPFLFVPEVYFKAYKIPKKDWFSLKIMPLKDSQRDFLTTLASATLVDDQIEVALQKEGLTMEDVYIDGYKWNTTDSEEERLKHMKPEMLARLDRHISTKVAAEKDYSDNKFEIMKDCVLSICNDDEEIPADDYFDGMPSDLKNLLWVKIREESNLTPWEVQALK